MSHPDPFYDPDNSYEDDDMNPNYDDHNDFYQECENYNDYYIDENNDFHDGVDGDDRTNEYWPNLTTGGGDDEDNRDEDYDDSMDGDHDSAMDSIGWGDDDSLAYGGGDYYGEDF